MDASVIDTLRYANRLREAGVEAGQAEAMARAINDELSVGVATRDDVRANERNLGHAMAELRTKLEHDLAELRDDLDHGLAELRGDLDHGLAELRGDLDRKTGELRVELDRTKGELRAELKREIAEVVRQIDVLKAEVNAKLDAQNGKFEAQGRHLFLTLALIAALGLYNAAAPHFAGTGTTVTSGGPPPTAAESPTNARPPS